MIDDLAKYLALQRRWCAQASALQDLALRAYDEDDWDVGDALQERADDLFSICDD